LNVFARQLARSDLVNITAIDNLGTANDQSFAYTPANRLSAATGEWGADSYSYDAAGNRLRLDKLVNGASTELTYAYGPLSSRLNEIATNGSLSRALAHDAAGNIIEDVRGANVYTYSYDAAGRLSGVSRDGVLWASYLYNGFGQLASRDLTAATGTPGTTHYLYDLDGHLIAEADALTGQTLREYLWLDALPIAVIDASGTEVWSAVWEPFGALHSVSGSINFDARFPGQWFELESGLHYNWHRHYDPSLDRYTQPDPIGMPDGPNRFAYAHGNPIMNIDPSGLRLKGGARPTNCKGLSEFECLCKAASPAPISSTQSFPGPPPCRLRQTL
jgi:RHS repeat-associated protein